LPARFASFFRFAQRPPKRKTLSFLLPEVVVFSPLHARTHAHIKYIKETPAATPRRGASSRGVPRQGAYGGAPLHFCTPFVAAQRRGRQTTSVHTTTRARCALYACTLLLAAAAAAAATAPRVDMFAASRTTSVFFLSEKNPI
jgi:hypothetical protein